MPDGKRVRVLWVAKGLGPGGMERLLVHHARAGDHDRYDYAAAYVVERPHSVVPELEGLGVPVHRLDARLGPVGWVRSLQRLVDDQEIDIVHLHSPAIAAAARPALKARRRRPALITTEHNSWDCYAWPTRLANVATYPLDDARLAVSNDAVQSVPRLLRGRSEVLVHGIDLDDARRRQTRAREVGAARRSELGIHATAPVALVVANHRHEKGWDILIEAVAEARKALPELVVLGVGHGQLEAQHRKVVAERGLGTTLRLLGFRDDVDQLLGLADVFCLASRQEGLPVAVMEAMAAGLPVIAPDVGGLGLAVDDDVSGRLVPPEDPRALAEQLVAVLADPDLRTRLAAGASEQSDRFDIRRAVDAIERRYESLADAR